MAALALTGVPAPGAAQLLADDRADLTLALERIAAAGWIQSAVDDAGRILADPRYDADDWAAFFREYFSGHRFTENLWRYLHLPVFFWLGDDVNLRLQAGTLAGLSAKIDSVTERHGPGLSAAMLSDAGLAESFFVSHRFLNFMARDDLGQPGPREGVYAYYEGYVERHPTILEKSRTLDTGNQQFVGSLRAQVYVNLIHARPQTPANKAALSTLLDLRGTYRRLWDELTFLVIDNNALSVRQLEAAERFVALFPDLLESTTGALRCMTVKDFLEEAGPGKSTPVLSRLGCPNVFGFEVGSFPANPFPDDVAAARTDTFLEVLAHEVNHGVDFHYVHADPALRGRRDALIAAAGAEPLNYLRSMFEPGFFQRFPQEFLASISNQWFADSEHTLRLGRKRFENGRPQALNQALFFAEIYSRGSDRLPLYRIDVEGRIERRLVTVERDGSGHIRAIAIGDSIHNFERALDGDVLATSSGGCEVAGGRHGDVNRDARIDHDDAEILGRFAIGIAIADAETVLELGDVTGDGTVDVRDAQQVARHARGLTTTGRAGTCRL